MNGNRGQYNSAPLYKINSKRGRQMQPQQQEGGAPLPAAAPRQSRAADTVLSVIMSIPLPILFLLSLLIANRPLRLTFLLLAAAAVALMWIMRSFVRSARSTLTVVYGELAAVIVVALIVSPGPVTRTAAPVSVTAQTGGSQDSGIGNPFAGASAQETPVPSTQTETVSPTEERLLAFFQAWGRRSAKDMLSFCVPSWVNQQQNPEETLFNMILDSTPTDYEFENADGSEGDSSRTASVKAHFYDLNGTETYKRVRVFMQKVNNEWYVDPNSLSGMVINEEAEAAQSANVHVNTTIAPTATPAANASGIMVYYNPKGGSYYHGKQNCPDVNQKYWPLTAFPYEMLNSQQYSRLLQCQNPECNAPARPPLQ